MSFATIRASTSGAPQLVTDRNLFDHEEDQLVTDRYQFQSVTNCNQLIRVKRLVSLWLGALTLFVACQPASPINEAAPREIHTPSYDLILPTDQNALLILFPCFSCDAADTRAESRIADTAAANGIAVLLMDFNERILMNEAEKEEVIGTIAQAVKEHELDASNTFIGGFSSGGNVAMLVAKALLKSAEPPVNLKGVFAVDSPLDLSHLYEASKHRVERPSFSEHKGEARMVVALLDSTLGEPTTNESVYETASPLMANATSVAPLKDLPVRLYTEPDTAWWWANRKDRYADLNAFALERIHGSLKAAGNTRAEYITTEGRGIQHGNRHPHAWSIVDERELVRWIKGLSH